MSSKVMNRRSFLKATAATVAAALVQACSTSTPAPAPTATSKPAAQPTAAAPAATATTKPAAPAATNTTAPAAAATATKPAAPAATTAATVAATKPAAAVTSFKEAPMLAELVKAGKLPPVEKRLPPAPQVIKPLKEVGQYGGTVRVAIGNVNQLFGDPQAVIGTELGLRIAPDFSTIVGGIFEAWEFNKDATVQTLHLRKGLLWSDGTPMTTADCLFDWEDCKLNKDLNPAGPPAAWRIGKDRTPMKMEALDDYTLKLTFAASAPLIILPEAFYSGCQYGGIFAPKKYGMQFHAKYAEAAKLDALVKEAKFERWQQLFGNQDDRRLDHPGLRRPPRSDRLCPHCRRPRPPHL